MNVQLITFDDVNIIPKFSEVPSRSAVDLSVNLPGFPYLRMPVLSANMDTVTGPEMSRALLGLGAQAVLHRFCSIEENVEMFLKSRLGGTVDVMSPMVSIGLGMKEIERAEALLDAGAYCFVIDVNHGANMEVVKQANMLREVIGRDFGVVVGNFATGQSIHDFLSHARRDAVNGFKIGIGGGSTCTTRVKTGVGIPQLSALMDCRPVLKAAGLAMIADGAMRYAGDVAKALGAGAHMVMTGGMLSGTTETPGEVVENKVQLPEPEGHAVVRWRVDKFKKYRGSASQESYVKQGKVAKHRTAEGESFLVPHKGPVADVIQDIEGGLRGAFSMVGAFSLNEFHDKCEFVRISPNGTAEARAHGKK